MKDNFIARYFKREERKAKKLHREVDPSSWPEYLTATQSRVRRVMAEEHATPRFKKVASSVESLYMDETAQDVAHAQVAKSKRGSLQRKIGPVQVLAWGGWGVVMLTFASSLLLNFPFGAGAFILKSLPGEPRTGEVVVLQKESKDLKPGDTLQVLVSVKGIAAKNIHDVSATLSYDPAALELQEISTDQSSFQNVVDSRYDPATGKVFLSLENEKSSVDVATLATLTMKVKTFVGQTSLQVIPETHISFESGKPAIPQKLGTLGLTVSPQTLSPEVVRVAQKQTSVTLDGNLDDWRDVITYDPASFKPSGTVISGKNIKEGKIASEKDFYGVMQLAADANNFYVAFSAADDEVLGDVIGIKLGSKLYEISLPQALAATYSRDGMTARATKQDGGYILEASLPLSAVGSSSSIPFNFEVHDVDSQDAAVVVLSYPNDSEGKR